MVADTLQLGKRRYVVVLEEVYKRLCRRAGATDGELPDFPSKLRSGNYPAVQALRVGLARKLINRRFAAGLSQAEVARRAGIRAETLNRIEKAKVTADTATVARIVHALEKAPRRSARAKRMRI